MAESNKDLKKEIEKLKAAQNQAPSSSGGGLGRILKYPYAIGKGKSKIPMYIGKLLHFIFYSFIGLLILAAIAYGILYFIAYTKVGGTASLATHAGVATEPYLDRIQIAGYPLRQLLRNPVAPYGGFESTVEQNEQNQDLGVKIAKVETTTPRIYENQPIFVKGEIKALALDDITATVSCVLDEEKVKAQLATASGSDTIKIFKNVPQTFTATCLFPGITVEEGKQIISKKIDMFVNYEFSSKATHNTYFLNKESADFLLSSGADPFKYYGIKEPLLKSDRTVRSKATQGPLTLGIGTFDSQPFSENTPYYFGVSMQNNPDWLGNLKSIKSLKVSIPPNIILGSDSEFLREQISATPEQQGLVSTTGCDFVNSGSTDDNGFKIYTLSEQKLKEVNRPCDKKSLLNTLLTEEDCLDIYKNNLRFLCQFMVTEDIPADNMYYDFIRADSSYVYETKKSVAVDVYQTPGEEVKALPAV